MTLPELGIKRYVMAFMVAASIILFGVVSYFRIGIAEFPNVDFPFVIILTQQQGADVDVVDNTITSVLLEKLNGIPGIDTISATSMAGISQIQIAFELNKSVDVAFNEVQAKVNQAMSDLPSGVDVPTIIKASSTSDPIMMLTISGNRTIQQINEYASEIIKKKLEVISGVSEVQIYGERDTIIKIELDINRLSNYGLGINDIIETFSNAHIQMPGGYIVRDKTELLLNLDFEYHNVNDLKNLVLKNSNGAFVRISDVGTVSSTLDDFRQFASYNSQPSVTLGLTSIVGSNAFDIEKLIMKKLNTDVIPNLEPGIGVNITSNSVDYIREVVAALMEHLFLGVFLTSAIVYLFLRNIVSTIIVSIAIPVSLLGAVIVMYAFGYTFNMITMLGLLLLIGVVVDDAIIVLENVYRKIENGEDAQEAAVHGSNQVVFAVLAATLSLVSIFGPVIFMEGIVGKFFQSFAVVVTFGVIISYFVSMYVTPMLCARYLRKSKRKEGKIKQVLEKSFRFLESKYELLLKYALSHKLIVGVVAIGIFASVFLIKVSVEFIADSDKSQFRVFVNSPVGANIYYSLEKIREVESILTKHSEVKEFVTSIGNNMGPVNRARITVNMVDIENRKISQADFVKKIQLEFNNVLGATVIASNPSAVGGGDYGFTFTIQGNDLQELYKYALQLQTALAEDSRIGVMDLDVVLLPKIKFDPDRDKLALLNLTSKDVVQAVAVAVGGLKISKYNDLGGNQRFDVKLQAKDRQINSVESLNNIYLKNTTGQLIRLDTVIKPDEYLGFGSMKRTGSLYSVQFSGNPNIALGDATKITGEIVKDILPSNYQLGLEGETKELQKTVYNMIFVFSLAVILLYMVLASQFNSFLQPLVLMMSVPLAIVGGIYGLHITGFSMNLFSMIGMILLVGLVAKNSILLIDFTNELRNNGKSINEALLEACPIRLRPILMTSLTIILTMLPASIARGAGSANNASMAIVVIGGMITSTLLTLIVIPCLYSAVESFVEYRQNKKQEKVQQLETKE